MPACVTRRFKGGQGAIVEARQKRARIVDTDRFHLPCQIVLAALNKRLGHAGDFRDRSVQPQSCVDGMRQKITRHSTACHRDVQTPQAFSTLRKIA